MTEQNIRQNFDAIMQRCVGLRHDHRAVIEEVLGGPAMTEPKNTAVFSGTLSRCLDCEAIFGHAIMHAPGAHPRMAMTEPGPREKHIHIGAPACFALEEAIRPVCEAFGVWTGEGLGACYLVGSTLERADWRDVDVRLMMPDAVFAREFPNAGDHWEHDTRWLLLTIAISEYLSKRTGLPIDFQFQPQTHANKRHNGRRNAIGIRFAKVGHD